MYTNNIGTTTNSEVFQFRAGVGFGTPLVIVNRVRISAVTQGTGFNASSAPIQIALFKSTNWTASGTGGTAVSLGATCKQRTTMASSSGVNDFRYVSSAGGYLGAGTKTLEANAMAALVIAAPQNTISNGQMMTGTILFESEVGNGSHPLVLASSNTQEGFSIMIVSSPSGGTFVMGIEVQWTECATY